MGAKAWLIQDSYNKPVCVCEHKHCTDEVLRFLKKKHGTDYKVVEILLVWRAEEITNAAEEVDEHQEKIDLIKKVLQ